MKKYCIALLFVVSLVLVSCGDPPTVDGPVKSTDSKGRSAVNSETGDRG
jgi:uncharacterized protein YcfL